MSGNSFKLGMSLSESDAIATTAFRLKPLWEEGTHEEALSAKLLLAASP